MEYTRPNRSDVHLTGDEAAKAEAAARDYFDGVAPKRHTKPQRSEYSTAAYADAVSSDDQVIPEYHQFQQLEKDDAQKVVYSGSKAAEEFTETEYYQDLNGIDKEHHTTGTGFITVDNTNEKGFSLAADADMDHHASSKGNPATNDWVPSTESNTVDFITDKPNRSG